MACSAVWWSLRISGVLLWKSQRAAVEGQGIGSAGGMCGKGRPLVLLLQELGCRACGTWNLVVGLLLGCLAGRALCCPSDCRAAKIRMPFIFFFCLRMEQYGFGRIKVSLIRSRLCHTCLWCKLSLSCENKGRLGKWENFWGIVTEATFAVFLHLTDTTDSLSKICTWHSASFCSASVCAFLEITFVWTKHVLTSEILSILSRVNNIRIRTLLFPLLFSGDKLIIFPVTFYFPGFAVPQTSDCYKNSQVAFAWIHSGELLNVNFLVNKLGLVVIFNYTVFCNASSTNIHLVDSNYS